MTTQKPRKRLHVQVRFLFVRDPSVITIEYTLNGFTTQRLVEFRTFQSENCRASTCTSQTSEDTDYFKIVVFVCSELLQHRIFFLQRRRLTCASSLT